MNAKRIYARLVFWPTWGWNLLLGRVLRLRPWWSRVEENVYLGARPLARDVATLRDMGIRSIVNTCEEFPGHGTLYDSAGIRQLHVPTTDFQPPTLEQTARAVDFINASLGRGEKTYVHCKAGRARSATILLCWLMQARGLSAAEAQARLLDCRPHVHPHLTERAVVREFEASLRRQTDPVGSAAHQAPAVPFSNPSGPPESDRTQ